jgi:hypothetical protein
VRPSPCDTMRRVSHTSTQKPCVTTKAL